MLVSAAGGAAALLWISRDHSFERVSLPGVFAIALLLRAIAWHAEPLLEDDHYRYLWDGWRMVTALDPYRRPPAAFFGDASLPAQWQDVLSGINHPELPSIYGPLLQWLFAAAHLLAPGRLGALQALLGLADLAVIAVLAGAGTPRRWLLAYAVHPLVLKEAIASAHPDVLVALWLLLAVRAWQRGSSGWLGVWLGLAVATKVSALVAVPLLLWPPAGWTGASVRRAATALGGAGAAFAVLDAPLVFGGGSEADALAAFAAQWRFNPLIYRAIEALLPAAAARPAAGLVVVATVALLAWRWGSGAGRALPPVDLALAALLLASPVVNPWYWLWALPLAVQRGSAWVTAAGAVAMVSYANGTVLAEAGWWQGEPEPFAVPWLLAALQLAVMLGAAAWAVSAQGSRDQASRRSSVPQSRS